MTASQKRTIKTWLPYTSLLGVFYLFYYVGVFTSNAQSRMFDSPAQKETIINHGSKGTDAYENVHMPRDQKDDTYVLRREFEMIQNDISEIKSDVKELVKVNSK